MVFWSQHHSATAVRHWVTQQAEVWRQGATTAVASTTNTPAAKASELQSPQRPYSFFGTSTFESNGGESSSQQQQPNNHYEKQQRRQRRRRQERIKRRSSTPMPHKNNNNNKSKSKHKASLQDDPPRTEGTLARALGLMDADTIVAGNNIHKNHHNTHNDVSNVTTNHQETETTSPSASNKNNNGTMMTASMWWKMIQADEVQTTTTDITNSSKSTTPTARSPNPWTTPLFCAPGRPLGFPFASTTGNHHKASTPAPIIAPRDSSSGTSQTNSSSDWTPDFDALWEASHSGDADDEVVEFFPVDELSSSAARIHQYGRQSETSFLAFVREIEESTPMSSSSAQQPPRPKWSPQHSRNNNKHRIHIHQRFREEEEEVHFGSSDDDDDEDSDCYLSRSRGCSSGSSGSGSSGSGSGSGSGSSSYDDDDDDEVNEKWPESKPFYSKPQQRSKGNKIPLTPPPLPVQQCHIVTNNKLLLQETKATTRPKPTRTTSYPEDENDENDDQPPPLPKVPQVEVPPTKRRGLSRLWNRAGRDHYKPLSSPRDEEQEKDDRFLAEPPIPVTIVVHKSDSDLEAEQHIHIHHHGEYFVELGHDDVNPPIPLEITVSSESLPTPTTSPPSASNYRQKDHANDEALSFLFERTSASAFPFDEQPRNKPSARTHPLAVVSANNRSNIPKVRRPPPPPPPVDTTLSPTKSKVRTGKKMTRATTTTTKAPARSWGLRNGHKQQPQALSSRKAKKKYEGLQSPKASDPPRDAKKSSCRRQSSSLSSSSPWWSRAAHKSSKKSALVAI